MSGIFIIPLSGLKEEHYTYSFEVGNRFFEQFKESEIKEGNLSADVKLDKRTTHFDLNISIKGEVRICCDRCLEMFFQPVVCENRLVVRFGQNLEDSDPDILTLPADEHELDISQFLYEFIHLALPIQRVHPDNEEGKNTCNPEMLEKLNEHIINKVKSYDPRWDDLKKLMNNN